MIATAPGKLILTGEYAVLDGAPAIVVAVDRRVIARQTATPRGSSTFLLAVADEIAARRGADDPATRTALEISVDSSAFYDKLSKLGLGSSAAVTVAATALALGTVDRTAPPSGGAAGRGHAPSVDRTAPPSGGAAGRGHAPSVDRTAPPSGGAAGRGHAPFVDRTAPPSGGAAGRGQAPSVDRTAPPSGGAAGRGHAPSVDRDEVLAVALAAHARAQGPRGSRGSGADIAASVYGGTIIFSRVAPRMISARGSQPVLAIDPAAPPPPTCRVERRRWPASVTLLPFFTGAAADTAALVARMTAARETNRAAVEAALAAITDASRAACAALAAPPDIAAVALIGALALAGNAVDRLALATAIDLVPACVAAARTAMAALGGTAKTTGAGGGDVGVAVIPATIDATLATRLLIEAGCQPLRIALDDTGVDLRADAS